MGALRAGVWVWKRVRRPSPPSGASRLASPVRLCFILLPLLKFKSERAESSRLCPPGPHSTHSLSHSQCELLGWRRGTPVRAGAPSAHVLALSTPHTVKFRSFDWGTPTSTVSPVSLFSLLQPASGGVVCTRRLHGRTPQGVEAEGRGLRHQTGGPRQLARWFTVHGSPLGRSYLGLRLYLLHPPTPRQVRPSHEPLSTCSGPGARPSLASCIGPTLPPQSTVPGVRMVDRSRKWEDPGPEGLKRAAQLLGPKGQPQCPRSPSWSFRVPWCCGNQDPKPSCLASCPKLGLEGRGLSAVSRGRGRAGQAPIPPFDPLGPCGSSWVQGPPRAVPSGQSATARGREEGLGGPGGGLQRLGGGHA